MIPIAFIILYSCSTVFGECRQLAQFGSNCATKKDISALITGLSSNDPPYADSCYLKLSKCGKEGISMLLHNAYNTNEYHGIAPLDYYSSAWVNHMSVGIVSIYLIEAIIHQHERPHLSMVVYDNDYHDMGESNRWGAIVDIYNTWWNKHDTNTLSTIRANYSNVLRGSQYYWFGFEGGSGCGYGAFYKSNKADRLPFGNSVCSSNEQNGVRYPGEQSRVRGQSRPVPGME